MDFAELLAEFKKLKTVTEKSVKDNREKDQEIEKLKASITSMASGPRNGSDEGRALSIFNNDISRMLSANTEAPEMASVEPSVKRVIKSLKEDILAQRFYMQKFNGEPRDTEDYTATVKGMMDGSYFGKNVLSSRIKSFGSSVVGGGAEYIAHIQPTTYVEEYQDHDLGLFSQLSQVTMYSEKQKILTKGRSVARASYESDTPPSTRFNTGDRELEAKKFVEYYEFPEEFKEDSAIDIIKAGIVEINVSHQRAYDVALISGTGAGENVQHIDYDVHAAANARDVRHHWDGFRKKSLDNSLMGATVDFNNTSISTLFLNKMYGRISKGSLLWVVSRDGRHQMMDLPETKTVNVAGTLATVQTGVLHTLYGIPIFETEFVRDDLNITGCYGPTANETAPVFVRDRTAVLLLNIDRLYAGNRSGIRVYLSRNQSNDKDELRGWSRKAFQSLKQDQTNRDMIYGINIKR